MNLPLSLYLRLCTLSRLFFFSQRDRPIVGSQNTAQPHPAFFLGPGQLSTCAYVICSDNVPKAFPSKKCPTFTNSPPSLSLAWHCLFRFGLDRLAASPRTSPWRSSRLCRASTRCRTSTSARLRRSRSPSSTVSVILLIVATTVHVTQSSGPATVELLDAREPHRLARVLRSGTRVSNQHRFLTSTVESCLGYRSSLRCIRPRACFYSVALICEQNNTSALFLHTFINSSRPRTVSCYINVHQAYAPPISHHIKNMHRKTQGPRFLSLDIKGFLFAPS